MVNSALERLKAIGFVHAGCWRCEGRALIAELKAHGEAVNVLYAFVCDGEVVYVGKSVRSLKARMYNYQKPGPSQHTNIRNNRELLKASLGGCQIETFVLVDTESHRLGEFHLNLAAGLEDSIIATLRPSWNGARTRETA